MMIFLFLDERQDVQKKTFTKWINSQLSKTSSPAVTDLFTDLRDGHKLLALLEILTNQKYVSLYSLMQHKCHSFIAKTNMNAFF